MLEKAFTPGIEEFKKQAEKFSLIPLDGKRPVEKNWTEYCHRKRKFHEADFLGHNAGVCCGPASGVLVLDVDDPPAFNSLVQTNGWVIPETYTVQTGSGKYHYYFEYPTDGKEYGNKSVKHPLLKKHTVFDIRGVGGQVVAAGSIHPATGNPYTIIKDVPAASLPDWLMSFLSGNEIDTEPLLSIPLSVPQDQEFVESLKLTESTKQLILKGKQEGERSEAMMTVINALIGAGYDVKTIYFIFDHYAIGEKYREKGGTRRKWLMKRIEKAKKYVKEHHTVTIAEERSLTFPYHVMSGAAGDFANVYGSHLETPREFLFMSYLTCLGSALSTRLTLKSEISPQPRLFTLLLGQSADERKSTSLMKTVEHFRSALNKFDVSWGVGSAEGLQKRIEDADGGLLLTLDEFKQFVSKCNIQGSVLLPCVNTLFESNRYESRTKKAEIKLEKAHLSLLAASTVQTYDSTWNKSFTDIGFTNRLFIVPGTAERKHAFPKTIPDQVKHEQRLQLEKIISHVGNYTALDIVPEAERIYQVWYMAMERSIHAKRIDTYALRLMSLLAVNELRIHVDVEIVQKVIALCNWQLEVRKLYDPIDADTIVAKMEQKIRRALNQKALKESPLKQKVNANRSGLWIYEIAKKNLINAKEIYFDNKKKKWRLVREYR